MLKQLLRALLCSAILIGKVHAQEVIVAREKKAEAPKPAAEPLEQLPSETPTPAPRKSKSREKKSREKKSVPARLTLEEMRAAGGRAAEGSNEPPVSQPAKTRESNVESAAVRNPPVIETPRPVKRETPVEQRSSSRSSKSRSSNFEGIGPIRPTMIESGREPPSPSPSGR